TTANGERPPALELYQAEWCPASHRVRELLTELGVDFVARQVPAARREREALVELTRSDSIPVLVPAGEPAVVGEERIAAYLADRYAEPPAADDHRRKADRVHRRSLEEECECPPTSTR
ncbi:MAG TPA: glutathione S-transferase N-terminal domain-containing protein, partial [Gaiellaceae bacterium]|nr:glutathione S-transferase N-terminal domain-containing protein [Gaiellaceae bacterium]